MSRPDGSAGPELVSLAEIGKVSVVRLCDPVPGNRMSPTLVRMLIDALANARGGALVLAADGKNFCTGGDHGQLSGLTPAQFRAYLDDLRTLFAQLAQSPIPVVACVQGAAIGGGAELVLPADFIVASEDASFRLPQIGLGIRLEESSYLALLTRAGLPLTRRMVLTGQRVGAAEAARLGLVDRVVSRAELELAATLLATELAEQPVRALQRARASIARLAGHGGEA